MSTKLNAEQLATKRYPTKSDDLLGYARNKRKHHREGYAAAIREHSQPIADERDELRKALEAIVNQWDWRVSKPSGELFANARAILAKYPKP